MCVSLCNAALLTPVILQRVKDSMAGQLSEALSRFQEELHSGAWLQHVALQFDSATFGQQLGTVFDEATVPGPVFQVGLEVPGDPASALYWDGLEDGRPVRYTVEPLASPWRRIFTPFIGAFMPEELL